jgi:hypothetical protein
LVLDEHFVCVIADSDQVVLIDSLAGKEAGRYTLTAPSTRTGEPPAAVGGPNALLLVVPRNYGTNLLRLDPRSGKTLWPEEQPVAFQPVAVESITLDSDALYFTVGDTLCARALADGRPMWTVPLRGPGRKWRTARTGEYIAAYPGDVRAGRLEVRGLLAAWEAAALLPVLGQSEPGFPVFFFEAKTGQLVQRLNLRGKRPAHQGVEWRFGMPLLPEVCWHPAPIHFQVLPQGVLVALEGQVWVRK